MRSTDHQHGIANLLLRAESQLDTFQSRAQLIDGHAKPIVRVHRAYEELSIALRSLLRELQEEA